MSCVDPCTFVLPDVRIVDCLSRQDGAFERDTAVSVNHVLEFECEVLFIEA